MADSMAFSEKSLIQLLHNKIPALVVVYNIKTGEYIYVNDVVKQLLGYSKKDFLQKGIAFATRIVHPDDLARIMQENQLALKEANSKTKSEKAHNSIVTFEYRMQHKDGSWRWLHSDGVVFDRDAKGKVRHVMNVSVDITKRKEAELETEKILQIRLAQEEVVTELGISALSGKSLKDILQEAAKKVQGVLHVDYVSILEYMPNENNMILRAGVGWSKNAVIDKTRLPGGKHSHPGYTLRVKKPVIIKDISKEKRFSISSPLRDHPAVSGLSCIIFGKENPYGVFGVHTREYRIFSKEDINFLQSVANLLALTVGRKQLEAQKDEFISIASHELKTPVTSLKAYTQVLRNRFAKVGDIDSATLLTKMDMQMDRLTKLIIDLLDSTKIQKGKLELNESYFDFNELIGEIMEEMQRATPKHKLIKAFGRSKTIHADRERIGQVLINFLSNAIKYSPQSKKIQIKTWSTKDSMSASVQDFGIGISKEKHRQLFERFFRVNESDVASFPGLGLGLFISNEIIKRHKGTIWVESEKGKGSTFGFSIPIDGRV